MADGDEIPSVPQRGDDQAAPRDVLQEDPFDRLSPAQKSRISSSDGRLTRRGIAGDDNPHAHTCSS